MLIFEMLLGSTSIYVILLVYKNKIMYSIFFLEGIDLKYIKSCIQKYLFKSKINIPKKYCIYWAQKKYRWNSLTMSRPK